LLYFRLHHRPWTSTPWLIVSITAAAGGLTSLLLFLFWQHKLREQIRLLDFHLSSKQVVEGKMRTSLQVLTAVVEAQSNYPDPAIQETASLALKHIRLLDKRIAYDHSAICT
jgi:hypothetical protein